MPCPTFIPLSFKKKNDISINAYQSCLLNMVSSIFSEHQLLWISLLSRPMKRNVQWIKQLAINRFTYLWNCVFFLQNPGNWWCNKNWWTTVVCLLKISKKPIQIKNLHYFQNLHSIKSFHIKFWCLWIINLRNKVFYVLSKDVTHQYHEYDNICFVDYKKQLTHMNF